MYTTSEKNMTRETLITLLQNTDHARVGLIGDLCLDMYWLADMKLSELSRETPHYPLPIVEERFAPGGAGNVANNIAALKPKKLLVAGGCNAADIHLAGQATENLRVLLKGYNDLRVQTWSSEYEKNKALYNYYIENYEALTKNFCDLYKTLKGLYENSAVSNYISLKGKTAHYRQLVGHLFVVSTALDQDVYRDEDSWRIDRKTLREVIEDVHYFPDGNWYPEELQ